MHERIGSLEEVSEDVGPEVRKVNLRQNRITRITAVPWLTQLEELDLYDNGISQIENLDVCVGLKYKIMPLLFHQRLI